MHKKIGKSNIIILTVFIFIFVLYPFRQSLAGEIVSPEEFNKAVIAGDTEKIKELLYKEPNFVNIKDDKGSTPLHTVVKLRCNAKYPRMKVMELLIYGMVQITDWTIRELHCNVDTDKLKKLINKKFTKDDFEKELNKSGFPNKEIQFILEYTQRLGADIHAHDNDCKTPLYYAPSKDIAELLISKCYESPLSNLYKKDVELLLSKGVDVNIKDIDGMTMLHHSIRKCNPSKEIIKLLISVGANVNIKNDRGDTPLHFAVSYCNKNDINLLLDAGADVNVFNNQGYSPLDNAIFDGNISMADFLISRGADVNAKDNKGQTILHHLIYAIQDLKPNIAFFEILEFLISRGADITIKDNKGKAPLDISGSEKIKTILIVANFSGILQRNIVIILPVLTLFAMIFSITLSKIIRRLKKK